jgi:hypothetical protein
MNLNATTKIHYHKSSTFHNSRQSQESLLLGATFHYQLLYVVLSMPEFENQMHIMHVSFYSQNTAYISIQRPPLPILVKHTYIV